jgi:hypothetical protein
MKAIMTNCEKDEKGFDKQSNNVTFFYYIYRRFGIKPFLLARFQLNSFNISVELNMVKCLSSNSIIEGEKTKGEKKCAKDYYNNATSG